MSSVAEPELASSPIRERYLERTPRSAALMGRAREVMPAGSTRTFGYFDPYPLVFERGEGVHLWDVDGHRYIDFTYNGLSLIHGHAFPPILEALATAVPRGTAWPGSSIDQIEFAECLTARIPHAEQVRFTNTGTEATMLGVKLARHATGRQLIVKFRGAYHGSYDDLEAGLYGIGELEGRTLLGDFGDLASFERAFAAHKDEIAAVVIEPILFTFRVIPHRRRPSSPTSIELAHDAGILRGARRLPHVPPRPRRLGRALRPPSRHHLSRQVRRRRAAGRRDRLHPRADVDLRPRAPNAVYHGGSFNGNPLGCATGRVTIEPPDRRAASRAWTPRPRASAPR